VISLNSELYIFLNLIADDPHRDACGGGLEITIITLYKDFTCKMGPEQLNIICLVIKRNNNSESVLIDLAKNGRFTN
jgi:hypothetical protein